MAPYSRPQLWILLALSAAGALGIAAGHWKRVHPDLVERLERFDAGDPSVSSASVIASAPGPLLPPADLEASHASRGAHDSAHARSRGTADGGASVPGRRATAPGSVARRAGSTRVAAADHGRAMRPEKLRSGDEALDVNRASAPDLERLPGVGPSLALRIVQTREASGGFGSIDDLAEVPGLGPRKLDALRAHVTLSAPRRANPRPPTQGGVQASGSRAGDEADPPW